MSGRTDGSDGGPAFPTHESDAFAPPEGMSLRDWFAGQALVSRKTAGMTETVARDAYWIADAMLKARES